MTVVGVQVREAGNISGPGASGMEIMGGGKGSNRRQAAAEQGQLAERSKPPSPPRVRNYNIKSP